MKRIFITFVTILVITWTTSLCSSNDEESDTEFSDTDALVALLVLQRSANSLCSTGISGCSSSAYSCDASSKCYFSRGDCVNSGDCDPSDAPTNSLQPKLDDSSWDWKEEIAKEN
ncbi:MAG: hypothetical protein KDK33_18955 [Leptospiraceae bacterium]|nr:hypothetical protein [Leptospiraceae bacterium]